MIELLILAGVAAVVILVVAGVLFLLHQRRQGTVRAVSVPRRGRDGSG